jgi:hypothetical protein
MIHPEPGWFQGIIAHCGGAAIFPGIRPNDAGSWEKLSGEEEIDDKFDLDEYVAQERQ